MKRSLTTRKQAGPAQVIGGFEDLPAPEKSKPEVLLCLGWEGQQEVSAAVPVAEVRGHLDEVFFPVFFHGIHHHGGGLDGSVHQHASWSKHSRDQKDVVAEKNMNRQLAGVGAEPCVSQCQDAPPVQAKVKVREAGRVDEGGGERRDGQRVAKQVPVVLHNKREKRRRRRRRKREKGATC
jgi:hypothetical protein